MNFTLKGIRIGRVIITTENKLKDMEIKIGSQEVFDLFIRAIKENKIVDLKKRKKEKE